MIANLYCDGTFDHTPGGDVLQWTPSMAEAIAHHSKKRRAARAHIRWKRPADNVKKGASYASA